jgi:endo-1,4-beta-xylanase
VATVSSAGAVTGVSAGSTTITVTTQDGGYTATCAVTVTASDSDDPDDSADNLYTLASFPVGVAVSGPGEDRSFLSLTEKENTIEQHFSQLTAGNIMKMSYLHPSEYSYTFDNADQLVDWAIANGKSVHGHTFIWHSDYQVPDWMSNYSGDFAAMLDEHVTTIADHFEGRVVSWDVVNEAIDESNNCWRDSLFYQRLGSDYVANAFQAARAADPDVDLYYNDYSTEGGNSDKLDCLLSLVDDLLDNNVPIDGVGFQMHVQIDWPSTSAMATAFQAIVNRGLKVKITELDVPLNNPWGSSAFPQYTSYTAEAAALQKARYKAIVQTYLDVVPANLRGGITVWGLWDGDSWLLDLSSRQGVDDWPLLFTGPADGPYEEKPSFDGVAEALAGQ